MKELVEKMIFAWFKDSGVTEVNIIPSHVKRMTAAPHVAADALLGPVTDEERNNWIGVNAEAFAGWLLACRRTRLTAPAKTPEERVTIERSEMDADPCHVTVFLDGEDRCCNMTIDHAKIYRLGLIAMLKQEGAE